MGLGEPLGFKNHRVGRKSDHRNEALGAAGRLESAVPRRLPICPCSATRTVLVLFADERRGIFRVAPGADFYSLSSAGKSALRDSHRFGRKSD